MSDNSSAATTISETVVRGGYCVGCGACASTRGSGFAMAMSSIGTYEPRLIEGVDDAASNFESMASQVCPFSDGAPNEDMHAARLFQNAPHFDHRIGRYDAIYVGSAQTGGFRERGSSGGLTNWILAELLRVGEVDGVIGVREAAPNSGVLFQYGIARSPEAVSLFSKSKYYPVEISEVMDEVRRVPGRYAVVGVPCFAKAIRSLCLQDPVLDKRIAFVVAIVCGHLKSTAFAESLAWQVGVAPEQLSHIDFRVKVKGQPANRYAIRAKGFDGQRDVVGQRQVFDLYGTDWGLGFFKLQACDYCDDIAGETADVTLGDAWLPNDVKDWRGTNILVVRNERIKTLLTSAQNDNAICLRSASADDFVRSQGANYRHRRDGLAIRLHSLDERGVWRPQRRIDANEHWRFDKRKAMILARVDLAQFSSKAFQEAKASRSLAIFYHRMRIPVFKYHRAAGSLLKFAVKNVVIMARKIRSTLMGER